MENNDKKFDILRKNSEEKISELEQKELAKLDSYLDDEDNDILLKKYHINSQNKNENKNISIFKSTDFNDFPESNPSKDNINNNKKLEIKIKNDINRYENNKIEEEKYNLKLYEIEENNSESNIEKVDDNAKDNYDSDNEINLEEQLKREYEGGECIDNEKLKEDISDNELLLMPKENIIQYKNYQILKLKTLIKTLRQEKESLMDNYKKTTDNFIKHIKELEFKRTGERPITAKIINKISSSSDIKKTCEDNINIANKEKCPNCGIIIKYNFMEHSLECIRKKYKCIYCNELMNIEEKTKHNESFYNKEKLFEAIKNKNIDYIIKALKHNFPINETILDNKTGDYFRIEFIFMIIKKRTWN